MSTIRSTNKKNGAAVRQPEPTAAARVETTPDHVRCRAYEIYCDRNGDGGDHFTDWLQAERELLGAFEDEPLVDRPRDESGPRSERLFHA